MRALELLLLLAFSDAWRHAPCARRAPRRCRAPRASSRDDLEGEQRRRAAFKRALEDAVDDGPPPPPAALEDAVDDRPPPPPARDRAPQFRFAPAPAPARATPEELAMAADASALTPEAKARVLRQMTLAFDHYPPQETALMLDALWEAGIDAGPQKVSVRQLLALSAEAEAIEAEAARRSRVPGASLEPLEDAMRVCRSRVRMYGKDAEFYMTPDAERVVWRWPQLWGEIFGGGT